MLRIPVRLTLVVRLQYCPTLRYIFKPGENMSYIELQRDGRSQGRFDLPDYIKSEKYIYKLNFAELGGGNGVVFNANKMATLGEKGPACAIKLLRQQGTARLDRFNNEIRVLKSLNSPLIAMYHDDGTVEVASQQEPKQSQSVRWLAMELGGSNMRQHVEKHGPLSLDALKSAANDICDAVEHLHSKGFIHRDIKPDNFVWKSTSKSLLMIDFGIAKMVGEDVSGRPMDTFTQIREFVGPVFFSSPELIEYAANKKHPVDHRSDIFQVGKLLWFLATGKISAGIPSKRDCPAKGKLRDKIVEMIDDDPDSRPQDLAQVKQSISAIQL
jgi:serine/threonine protein kinase